MPNAVSAVYLE